MSLANLVANQPASVVTPTALAPAGPPTTAIAPTPAAGAPAPAPVGGGGQETSARRAPPPGVPRGQGNPLQGGWGRPAGSAMQSGSQPLSPGRHGWEAPLPEHATGAISSNPSAPAAMSGATGGGEPLASHRTTAAPRPWSELPRAQRQVGPPATPFVGAHPGNIDGPIAPAGPPVPAPPRPRVDDRNPHPQSAGAIPSPQRQMRAIPGTPPLPQPLNVAPGPQTPVHRDPAVGAGAPIGLGHGRAQERPRQPGQPLSAPAPASASPAKARPVAIR
jgi:hypothetical protein